MARNAPNLNHDPDWVRGWNFVSMIIIKSSTNDGINLNSEAEKSRLSIFLSCSCSIGYSEERGHWLIILHVCISFLVSFFSFIFIPYVRFKLASMGKMYWLSKVSLIGELCYSVFSSWIFRLGSLSIDLFQFLNLFIHIFIFSKHKLHFHHAIIGFWPSKEVWKHLIDLLHLLHTSPFFINHFDFLNSKNAKNNPRLKYFSHPPFGLYLNFPLF